MDSGLLPLGLPLGFKTDTHTKDDVDFPEQNIDI
jgi:hypothetical protein